jgi:hypothetical protein
MVKKKKHGGLLSRGPFGSTLSLFGRKISLGKKAKKPKKRKKSSRKN